MTLPLLDLMLLRDMQADCSSLVLDRAGMSPDAVKSMRTIPDGFPDIWIGQKIGVLETSLNCSAARRVGIDASPNENRLRRDYALALWPRLFWSVYSVGELVYAWSFTPGDQALDPVGSLREVSPGESCLGDLEALGATWELVDGWGHELAIRISRGNETLVGHFVFQLFQGWDLRTAQ